MTMHSYGFMLQCFLSRSSSFHPSSGGPPDYTEQQPTQVEAADQTGGGESGQVRAVSCTTGGVKHFARTSQLATVFSSQLVSVCVKHLTRR